MSQEFEEKVIKILGELSTKMDENYFKLDAKIDEVDKRLSSKIDEVDKRLSSKIDEVDKRLTSRIDAHSVELADIKRYLVIIEDKLSNQIPALFDGYSMNVETTNQIKSRQEATDKKVEINSFKISELEKTSRIHDKELKRILAN
jgi:tetrahydromethanopterin S-methyltransferase subunit G